MLLQDISVSSQVGATPYPSAYQRLTGTQIWNAPVLSLPIVSSLSTLPQLPLFLKTLALNESIILSSASILFLNAVLTFFNVYSSLKPNTSFTKPLLQTFSFVVDTHLHLCWIGSAYFFWGGGEDILHSEMLIPFICMWGIQYCHYVRFSSHNPLLSLAN
jgi:hypothetical protein